MRIYKNLLTGEIEIIHPWNIGKKMVVSRYSESFAELITE